MGADYWYMKISIIGYKIDADLQDHTISPEEHELIILVDYEDCLQYRDNDLTEHKFLYDLDTLKFYHTGNEYGDENRFTKLIHYLDRDKIKKDYEKTHKSLSLQLLYGIK
jgi:hypothetical protein